MGHTNIDGCGPLFSSFIEEAHFPETLFFFLNLKIEVEILGKMEQVRKYRDSFSLEQMAEKL